MAQHPTTPNPAAPKKSTLPIGNPHTTTAEERTAEQWKPRLQEMLDSLDIRDPNQWVNATEAWGIRHIDGTAIQDLLWNEFRDKSNPDDPGLRIIANKVYDPDTGKMILYLRLVRRGEMVELERDRANAGSRYS